MTIAQRLAAAALAATPTAAMREMAERLVLDAAGLCVGARNEVYVQAMLDTAEGEGSSTAIGHARAMTAADAALINGTAAHGEDYDDTFEGGPVHAGAVVVPAVLSAAERFGLSGQAALAGIAAGSEATCRLSTVVPKAVHKSGFHPTSVFGTVGAALGVGVALKLPQAQLVNALGIAGSFASGIIEYLADGSWTKRAHPGWAAQAGVRAALLARSGFIGPLTVFEGKHGLFNGFAHTTEGDWAALLDGFGERWIAETIAFKPYACGTMIHPYIDCARRLAARGIAPERIMSVTCETAEGILHRLWEPLAFKQAVPNAYAAKFSVPFGIAAGFLLDGAYLDAFTEARVADPRMRALAAKVSYVVDPANPYPKAFTGHVKLTLDDGTTVEERQPHFRGGASEPLPRSELEAKCIANCRHGGWSDARAEGLLRFAASVFDAARVDAALLRA